MNTTLVSNDGFEYVLLACAEALCDVQRELSAIEDRTARTEDYFSTCTDVDIWCWCLIEFVDSAVSRFATVQKVTISPMKHYITQHKFYGGGCIFLAVYPRQRSDVSQAYRCGTHCIPEQKSLRRENLLENTHTSNFEARDFFPFLFFSWQSCA